MAQETTAKVTKRTELTPDQVRDIIKEYYERQGVTVTRVDFNVGAQPSSTFEDYGTPIQVLRGAVVVEETSVPGVKLPAPPKSPNDIY